MRATQRLHQVLYWCWWTPDSCPSITRQVDRQTRKLWCGAVSSHHYPASVFLNRFLQRVAYAQVTTDTEQQYLNVLCLSPSAIRAQLPTDATAGSMSFTVSHTEQYALLLLQCSRSYGGPVDLRVTAKAVNPNTRGQLVHFLGMEDVPMPKV
jgi:hypothetical protein